MQAETLSNKINTPSVADIAPKIQLIKKQVCFGENQTTALAYRTAHSNQKNGG